MSLRLVRFGILITSGYSTPYTYYQRIGSDFNNLLEALKGWRNYSRNAWMSLGQSTLEPTEEERQWT